jgi:Copine
MVMIKQCALSGSNGDPCSDSSLHYVDPSHRALNQYQQAILNIGSILEEYDSDQRFPVYGKYCANTLRAQLHCMHYYTSLALCDEASALLSHLPYNTMTAVAATALSLFLLHSNTMQQCTTC